MAELKDSILDKVQGSVERLQRSIRKEEETYSLLHYRHIMPVKGSNAHSGIIWKFVEVTL